MCLQSTRGFDGEVGLPRAGHGHTVLHRHTRSCQTHSYTKKYPQKFCMRAVKGRFLLTPWSRRYQRIQHAHLAYCACGPRLHAETREYFIKYQVRSRAWPMQSGERGTAAPLSTTHHLPFRAWLACRAPTCCIATQPGQTDARARSASGLVAVRSLTPTTLCPHKRPMWTAA